MQGQTPWGVTVCHDTLEVQVQSCDGSVQSIHDTTPSIKVSPDCRYGTMSAVACIVEPRRCCKRYRRVVMLAPDLPNAR